MARNAYKYVARKGSGMNDDDAQLFGREVEKMERDGVQPTAAALVERASSEKHPLHGYFEWDNDRAGREWRIRCARVYLGALQVIDIRIGKPVRAVWNITKIVSNGEDHKERVYMPRRDVLGSENFKEQVSRQLYTRLLSAVREAEGLSLQDTDRAWKRLCQAVRGNVPGAVQVHQESEVA